MRLRDLLKDKGDGLAISLLEAACCPSPITGNWEYCFGGPINTPAHTAIGSHMFTPVSTLSAVLDCARRCLVSGKLCGYMDRLSRENRHQDTLAEMMPLLPLSTDIPAEFEDVSEVGGRIIDWRLSPSSGPPILFDVKNRIKDLVEFVPSMVTGAAPQHDPSLLFRSVAEKFAVHSPSECVHGAWILTQIKQEESKLQDAFDSLDHQKVHFAVIANWKNDCYLLVRDTVDRNHLTTTLQLRKTPEKFIFRKQ